LNKFLKALKSDFLFKIITYFTLVLSLIIPKIITYQNGIIELSFEIRVQYSGR